MLLCSWYCFYFPRRSFKSAESRYVFSNTIICHRLANNWTMFFLKMNQIDKPSYAGFDCCKGQSSVFKKIKVNNRASIKLIRLPFFMTNIQGWSKRKFLKKLHSWSTWGSLQRQVGSKKGKAWSVLRAAWHLVTVTVEHDTVTITTSFLCRSIYVIFSI